jgi:hypothetical protein
VCGKFLDQHLVLELYVIRRSLPEEKLTDYALLLTNRTQCEGYLHLEANTITSLNYCPQIYSTEERVCKRFMKNRLKY